MFRERAGGKSFDLERRKAACDGRACDSRSWAQSGVIPEMPRMLAEARLTAAVYDPPASGLPHIAVLFDAEGDVIAVRTAGSIDEGEAALANLIADISATQHATA